MKFYIKTLIISMLIVTISCNEDILDLKPLNAVSEVDIFNDETLLAAYVSAGYSQIKHLHESNTLLTVGLHDLSTFKKNRNLGQAEYQEARVISTNGEHVARYRWDESYGAIRHINSYFDKIEGSSISQEKLDLFSAEMYFLRAYYYFELVKWYGGVPIVDKRYELDEADVTLPRASIDEVINFIVGDLDKVINSQLGMVTAPTRASKAAAMAMKGRVLLYAASPLFNENNDMSKWDAAAQANKAVMDMTEYPMSSDYGKIFSQPHPLESEIIFAKEYNLEINQGQSSGANTLLFPNGYGGWQDAGPTQVFIDMFDMTNGENPFLADRTTINPASGYDPQNPYVNRDPRFEEIVFYNGQLFQGREVEYWIVYEDDGDGNPAGRTTVPELSGKDTQYGVGGHEYSLTGYSWRKHTDENLPIDHNKQPEVYTPDVKYRKSEFYLNYAETQLALGNEGAARDAINAVRARPSVNMPPISYSGEDLVEAYRRERAIELSFEDHRFFDIRRWKIAEDVMGKPWKGVDIEKLSNGNFVYNYEKVANESLINAWDDKLYWLPIPENEILTAGGSWDQNPGY